MKVPEIGRNVGVQNRQFRIADSSAPIPTKLTNLLNDGIISKQHVASWSRFI